MTQEEKQLLFEDLCRRLRYGMKCQFLSIDGSEFHNVTAIGSIKYLEYKNIYELNVKDEYGFPYSCDIEYIKPYLRPLSSMTVEEICKIEAIIGNDFKYGDGELTVCGEDVIKLSFPKIHELMEFLYQRHIDVNCLIEKGLAIEAEKGMYNF